MSEAIYRWRRSDGLTLEVVRLHMEGDNYHALSRLVDASPQPFVIDYEWHIDHRWRTQRVSIRMHARDGNTLLIERTGEASWRVDGSPRLDLGGCDEVDLSITPFCNTLALKQLEPAPGGFAEMTALYVSFPGLTCVPSRQRYERLGPSAFRYVDLGVHRGFEAQLSVDEDGFIRNYEGLFDRIEPSG